MADTDTRADSERYAHDYRTCEVEDCESCQQLVDEGLIMACDECGNPGSSLSDSWHLMDDGRTLCGACYRKEAAIRGRHERE